VEAVEEWMRWWRWEAMIRVVLADDQAVVRAGFRLLIDSAPDLEVVGEAATGREAVDLVRRTRADVVLMDVRMPEMDGLAATRAITGDEDLVGVRVLVLTTFEVDEYVFRALRAGASGFLGKGVEPADLLEGIRVVARGEALLSAVAVKGLIARFLALPDEEEATERLADLEVLTDREREVLTLVAAGLSNDEIAAKLFVSPLTAKTHVNRAMVKLGVRDRAQLVVIAYETGLVRARRDRGVPRS
jgi:DNA-binding NarL/FixJ family response regulator